MNVNQKAQNDPHANESHTCEGCGVEFKCRGPLAEHVPEHCLCPWEIGESSRDGSKRRRLLLYCGENCQSKDMGASSEDDEDYDMVGAPVVFNNNKKRMLW